MNAQRALGSFRAPEEAAAQERTWTVVRDAYRLREPVRRRRSRGRLLLVAGDRDPARRGDVVAGRRNRGAVDPPRARGPARRAGAVPAARTGKRAGLRGRRDLDGRGRRVRAGGWAPGARRAGLRTACSWRSRGATSWRRWTRTARFTGRSRDRPCATPAGISPRAIGWRTCRAIRCGWSPETEPAITCSPPASRRLRPRGSRAAATGWPTSLAPACWLSAAPTASGSSGPRRCQARLVSLPGPPTAARVLAVTATRASLYDPAATRSRRSPPRPARRSAQPRCPRTAARSR